MRITIQTGIVFVCAFLLAACGNRPPCAGPKGCTGPHPDLWQETWQPHVMVPNKQWTKSINSAFFAAEPTAGERRLSRTPFDRGLTVLAVRVPAFTAIRLDGCFQTQIIGNQDQTSLYIAGTQDAIRQTPVEIQGKGITVRQTRGDACLSDLRHVIVRIGVARLNRLAIYGGGDIEARNIVSGGLRISAAGSGNTVISGHFPVQDIQLTGSGNLTLIGVDTSDLSVNAPGSGSLFMRGSVGICSLQHAGSGQVSIMNAWSRNLPLDASGCGMTTLQGGNINLTSVTAKDSSKVYVAGVESSYIRVKGYQTAEIGLAGRTDSLEVSLKDSSRFLGANLASRVTYVDTQDAAHTNVEALGRLFAKASNESSIYYCATTGDVTAFKSGAAVILPRCFGSTPWKMPAVWTRAYK